MKCTIVVAMILRTPRIYLKAQPHSFASAIGITIAKHTSARCRLSISSQYVYQGFVPAKPHVLRHVPSVVKGNSQFCRVCNIRYGWYARMGTGPPIQHCGGPIESGERKWTNLFPARDVGETRLDVCVRRTVGWNDAPSILCHLAARAFRNLSRYSSRVSWKDGFCVSVSCVGTMLGEGNNIGPNFSCQHFDI